LRTEFQSKKWQGGVHLGADGVDGMAVRSGFRSDGAWEGGNEHVSSLPYKTERLFTSCATVGGSRVGLKWTKYVGC